jgi:hypothetical protein
VLRVTTVRALMRDLGIGLFAPASLTDYVGVDQIHGPFRESDC